jgi:hypothetical protein
MAIGAPVREAEPPSVEVTLRATARGRSTMRIATPAEDPRVGCSPG